MGVCELNRASRRDVVLAATAAGFAVLLGGCAGKGMREGGSSHAARAPADVQPLVFDPLAALQSINATRGKYLLARLRPDPRLQQAAQNHADYLGRTGKFGHEFGGETLFPHRIAAVGFDGSAGENLGVGYGSIDEAIAGWLGSPKHREIFMRARYDLAGIAYAFNTSGKNPRYTHYWVMIVGQDPPPGLRMGPLVKRI